MSDPATYQNDWGGPSLIGVLLVHMGPGILCAVLIVLGVVRWWKRQTGQAPEAVEARPRRP